jgi:hypothetical protein
MYLILTTWLHDVELNKHQNYWQTELSVVNLKLCVLLEQLTVFLYMMAQNISL